jgi:hypothetical protein
MKNNHYKNIVIFRRVEGESVDREAAASTIQAKEGAAF